MHPSQGWSTSSWGWWEQRKENRWHPCVGSGVSESRPRNAFWTYPGECPQEVQRLCLWSEALLCTWEKESLYASWVTFSLGEGMWGGQVVLVNIGWNCWGCWNACWPNAAINLYSPINQYTFPNSTLLFLWLSSPNWGLITSYRVLEICIRMKI